MVDVDLGTRFSLQRIELHWRSNFSVLPLPPSFRLQLHVHITSVYLCVCARPWVRLCVCSCMLFCMNTQGTRGRW